MPISYWFRCDICRCMPDTATRDAIGASTREDMLGELIDAMPGNWLVWHAGGLLGPRRYACPEHRKQLLKSIRLHYAYTGEQWVWKQPPFPQRWPPDGISASSGTLTLPDWLTSGPVPDEPPDEKHADDGRPAGTPDRLGVTITESPTEFAPSTALRATCADPSRA